MWPDLDISICIGPCNAPLPVSLPHTPPYAYFFSMWTFFQRTQSLSSLMDSGRGWGPGHQTYSISCNSWGYLQNSLCKSMQCYQLKIYYQFALFTNMFLFFQLWCFPLATASPGRTNICPWDWGRAGQFIFYFCCWPHSLLRHFLTLLSDKIFRSPLKIF